LTPIRLIRDASGVLHYGEPQVGIGIAFLLLTLIIAAVFVTVARHTRSDEPFERVQTVGYWLRKRWLAFLVLLLVLVVGLSLFRLPYAKGGHRTVVDVVGGQFYWIIRPAEIPVDTPIRFDVTSRDVNHGFGVYDPAGHLVGSVQAMPGYHNKLDLTFHTPGTYRVLCFEFCGLAHHLMQGSFTVR
jgi:cytochrome c oxidase subunit 2